jgi:hypothetical protein
MAIVYLSSTLDDLKAERTRIEKLLQDAGHQVLHSYRASTEPTLESCKQDVARADIYLLLCGQRYGWRPPDGKGALSITECEFAHAVERTMPTIALFHTNPPFAMSDLAQGRADDAKALDRFHAKVRAAARPGQWASTQDLDSVVLIGVNEAVRALDARKRQDAPAITPGVSRPHQRLLSHPLLLVHLRGEDEATAARLAGVLADKAVGLRVERFAWDPEQDLNWAAFDKGLAQCRGMLLLLTGTATRLLPRQAVLARMLALARQQTGYTAALLAGAPASAAALLTGMALTETHALDAWAAAPGLTITPDLATAIKQMCNKHADLRDPALVGLQVMVVAMTRAEAVALRDDADLRADLGGRQRRFLELAMQVLGKDGADWTQRYGDEREDWKPFGTDGALALLQGVVDRINSQTVVPRRDQEALVGHRVRLRPYPFGPLLEKSPEWQDLIVAARTRRLLLLVDELSLCHPKVRAAATAALSDAQAVVATVAPVDPPALTIDAAVEDNGVLQLGSLVERFMVSMDPTCEINLSSGARLKRWLRLSIPEALSGQTGAALEVRRAKIRQAVRRPAAPGEQGHAP